MKSASAECLAPKRIRLGVTDLSEQPVAWYRLEQEVAAGGHELESTLITDELARFLLQGLKVTVGAAIGDG